MVDLSQLDQYAYLSPQMGAPKGASFFAFSREHPRKPPLAKEVASAKRMTEDCISPQAKCAKQTRVLQNLFTSYVLLCKTQSSAPVPLRVCDIRKAAKPPTAVRCAHWGTSFHWIAVSGFAAYGYRVPLAGKRRLLAVT